MPQLKTINKELKNTFGCLELVRNKDEHGRTYYYFWSTGESAICAGACYQTGIYSVNLNDYTLEQWVVIGAHIVKEMTESLFETIERESGTKIGVGIREFEHGIHSL